MKTIIALILAIAATTYAVEVTGPKGERRSDWPLELPTPTTVLTRPSATDCVAAGWRETTAAELKAERDAALAELAAQQERAIADEAKVQAEKAELAAAVITAKEIGAKESAALEEAQAAAGGKTPSVEERLAILEKAHGIKWK